MNKTTIIKQLEEMNPSSQISDRELDMILLRMGSFLSIASNKKINQAKLLVTIVKNKSFQKCILDITESNNLYTLIQCLLQKYPTLYKSKVLYKMLKRNKCQR